jgi:hypothetical protein
MFSEWSGSKMTQTLSPTTSLGTGTAPSATSQRRTLRGFAARDRLEYRFIFAVCLGIYLLTGLLERCNPMWWLGPRERSRQSLWMSSKEYAHHCATIAFQG